MNGTTKALILVAAALVATKALPQVPLSVDTTFRTGIHSVNVFSVLPVEDDKLIISGKLDLPGLQGTRSGARLLPNGQRDPDFVGAFMGGKLVRWGDHFYSGNGQIVRRFTLNGALDPSFILMNNDPLFSSEQGGDYHVFPDGRLLFTGLHLLQDPAHGFQGAYNLIWFTNTGHLDTTRVHRSGNGANWAIKELPAGTAGGLGGKFLCHTWGTMFDGQPVDKVFRIHADGSLDTTFRSHIEWGYVWAIHPLLDGRAYLGGTFRMEGGIDTVQVIRVMPDGSLDPSFNNDLEMVMGQEFTFLDAGVTCVMPIGPDLLAITGLFAEVEGASLSGICMLDTLGNVLPSFFQGGGCGSYQYQIGQLLQTYGSIEGMAQAPDGDYYIWGAYHGYNDGTTNDTLQRMVSRLHGGELGLGVAPLTAGERLGVRVYPNPSAGHATLALEQVPPAAQVVVRDALGREVMRQRIGGHYTMLSFAQSGVYVVELWSRQGRLAVERVVVRP